MVRTPMVRKYQLSLFLTLLVSFSAAHAVSVTTSLAPQTIKTQVENAVSYRYTSYYSYYKTQQEKTYAEVADDVITSKSLAALVKTYTLADIFSWQGGSTFFLELANKITTLQEAHAFMGLFTSSADVISTYNALYYNSAQIFEKLLTLSSTQKANSFAMLLYAANQIDSNIFTMLIPSITNATAQQRLSNIIKQHIINELKTVSLDQIIAQATPTTLHMASDYITTHKVVTDISSQYALYKTPVTTLLSNIVVDEKKLIAQGYYVFFHSQRWDYLLLEKLYTDLWALSQHKTRPKNYLFPHIRVKNYDPLKQKGAPLDRATILQQGRTDMRSRRVLLFVNNSLFGKYANDPYSSALYFFLSNSNVNGTITNAITISTEDVFVHYNLKKLYTKYQKDITSLEQLFKQAQTLGTILMVALPKNMVQDYCFAAIPGGYLNPAAQGNTVAFLGNLAQQSNTFNNEEFCIIMLDEALNPNSGMLIQPYHCAEPTAFKKFEAEYEKLIQKITKEFAQKS